MLSPFRVDNILVCHKLPWCVHPHLIPQLIIAKAKQYLRIIMDRPYEDGGIYIILTTISANRWHWGLFICVSDTYGIVYHSTNTNGDWMFEDHMTENVVSSQNIVAALQIGSGIQEQWAQAAHDVLIAVPVIIDGGPDPRWGENFTCRIWVIEACDRLREAGLIPDEPARDVEDDAYRLARAASSTGTRRMGRSRGLRAHQRRN